MLKARKNKITKTTSKISAKNNRTTFVSGEEILEFEKRLLFVESIEKNNFFNKTIFGSIEDVAKRLPENFVDLLFIDPPYNLDKDFGNNKFKSKSDEEYEKVFEKWFLNIGILLKIQHQFMFVVTGKVHNQFIRS